MSAYKSILVHVSDPDLSGWVVDIGLAMAQQFEAHLIALHIFLWGSPRPATGVVLRRSWREELATERRREPRCRAWFDARRHCFRAGGCEWRIDAGDIAARLALHARYADLVLMGQDDGGVGQGGLVGARAALQCGRPIMVMPDNRVERPVGERVLVAWAPTRGAAFSVSRAMPLLQRARQVDVVVVGDAAGRPGAGTGIARYIAHHGVEVSVTQVPRSGLRTEEVMLSVAAERGSHLLCMGVCGYSRLGRLVLGTVTRAVMRHMNLPTLIGA